jgi:hypothetical protein
MARTTIPSFVNVLVLATTLLFATETVAFWRLPCGRPVSVQRADPIVNPGVPAGHLHTVMGGSGFDVNTDFNKARSSTCSSCKVKEDLSNYWIPALFYRGQDGTFTNVKQLGGMLVYYL